MHGGAEQSKLPARKLPAPKVAGVCCQGWKFTQGAMHLIYQSLTALISCAIDWTAHGGLFFVQIRVIGQFISGLNA